MRGTMTDADTPRVPELWWSKKMGVLRRSPSGRMDSTDDGHTLIALPADAVKLGDVEKLRAELEHWRGAYERLFAVGEKRATDLADIRAWLDQPGLDKDVRLVHIRAILDREPGREAMLTCPHCRTLIHAASGNITQADVDQHLADCEPAWQFARECATAALDKDRARAARGHVVEHQPDTEERQ